MTFLRTRVAGWGAWGRRGGGGEEMIVISCFGAQFGEGANSDFSRKIQDFKNV